MKYNTKLTQGRQSACAWVLAVLLALMLPLAGAYGGVYLGLAMAANAEDAPRGEVVAEANTLSADASGKLRVQDQGGSSSGRAQGTEGLVQPISANDDAAEKDLSSIVPMQVVNAEDGGAAAWKYPEILGQVKIRLGWAVSKRSAKIYGSGGKTIMSRVAAVNAGLGDLDKVRPGQVVAFPALRTAAPPLGARLVRVGKAETLEQGLIYLEGMPKSWPELRLFATYHPDEGMSFEIVLDHIYMDAIEVRHAVVSLPPELASKSVILEDFLPRTVFFSKMERKDGPDPLKRTLPGAKKQMVQSSVRDAG